MGRIKDKLFSFQDMFPLIAGKYKLTILLKNTVSREFTSMESDVEIPETPAPGLAAVVLANRMIENSSYRGQSKPFLIGAQQLLPSPRNDFLASDTLFLFAQLPALSNELKSQGSLQFDIFKDNVTVSVKTLLKKIADYPGLPDVVEKFPLNALPPANYTLRVTLLSAQGKAVASVENTFFITPVATLPRPWVMSVPLPSITAPQYWNDLGNQYLNLQRLTPARTFIEKAYHLAPQNPGFAMDFCRVLMEMKDYQQAKAIALLPFKNQGKNEFLGVLAQSSHALKQYGEAIDYYNQQIAHFGGSPKLLNAVGECYLALGNSAEAVKTWEQSLKIDAKQEKLRERLTALKGEKK